VAVARSIKSVVGKGLIKTPLKCQVRKWSSKDVHNSPPERRGVNQRLTGWSNVLFLFISIFRSLTGIIHQVIKTQIENEK
jgi:hypothetical protein